MKTFVVIPTYNEKENLPGLITALLALDTELHLVVVDDASPDGTGSIADEIAANEPRVNVIHRIGKLGLGTAYVAGFRYALGLHADRVLTMDADFSHNPAYVPDIIALCSVDDVGIGSRYVAGGGLDAQWGLHRRLLSAAANRVARTMLDLRARDCTSGFRCYRSEVLRTIPLDEIRSNGYSFLVEMLFRCQERGFRIGETPILFEDRHEGTSKISQMEILRGVKTVMRLWLQRIQVAR